MQVNFLEAADAQRPYQVTIYTLFGTADSDNMNQYRDDVVDATHPSLTPNNERLKQRSLLPQPGTPRIADRSTAISEFSMDRSKGSQSEVTEAGASVPATSIPLTRGTSVTGSRLGRLRPRSTYQAGSAAAERSIEVEKTTA